MTKIKVCGLFREREIDFVNQYLPDYAGFIISRPRHPHSLSPEGAEALVRLLNPGIQAVAVLSNQPLEAAVALLSSGCFDALQLDGQEDEAYIRALREQTGRPVFKRLSLRTPEELTPWSASCADLLVLAPGVDFPTEQLLELEHPYFLSGALHPGNVVKAVKQLHPYGVDLSTGIESGGVKDKGKLSSTLASVRGIKERIR